MENGKARFSTSEMQISHFAFRIPH